MTPIMTTGPSFVTPLVTTGPPLVTPSHSDRLGFGI
jgi:hypothetical protein